MALDSHLNTSSIDIRLREIDEKILVQLCEGRGTTGYIAKEINEQQPYVSRRLGELVDAGIVTRVDRGLYELPSRYRVIDDE